MYEMMHCTTLASRQTGSVCCKNPIPIITFGMRISRLDCIKFYKSPPQLRLTEQDIACILQQTQESSHDQKAGNCIELVVANTHFNVHLPYFIADAYKLSIWDQNGKMSPEKYCTTTAFFIVTMVNLGCLSCLVTKWQRGVQILLRDGKTEAL